MSIIQGAAHTSAGGGTPANAIERSLRFNSADTAYLSRTFGTPTSQNVWSFSAWVKRSKLGANQFIFWAGTTSTNDCALYFTSSDQIGWFTNNGSSVLTTSTAVFRDPSAWYHVVAIANSTTMNVWVNNQQVITNAGMTNNTINSAIAHNIGRDGQTAGNEFSGYITEVYFVDGQALTTSSFGETDSATGVWKPKKYSSTYGNNGFYLKFLPSYSGGSLSTDYLVVAGGGGGGGFGGGGAGGYRELTSQTLSLGTAYTVTVGAGGSAGTGSTKGGNGSNSVFASTTSTGGGGGGAFSNTNATGADGGSGGGGGTDSSSPYTGRAGGTATSGQGYNGGSGVTGGTAGGGGGGASMAGGNASANIGGGGGNGTASSISGSSVTRAGGGGGGGQSTRGAGGSGGGGQGGVSPGGSGVAAGTANTGGGGGGGYNSAGAAGGSGVVIIKIPSTYSANFTSGVTFSLSTAVSGYKIYTVTATSTTSETVTFV